MAVDLTPTDEMAAEAKRGLAWREEHGRGGTAVGVARARDISNKKELSPETIGRMVSYFARHEVDKQGQGWSPGEDGYPSAGRIAWALWGGDPGRSWANKKQAQLEKDKSMDKHFTKATLAPGNGDYVSFIASTSEEDRMGDVIRQDGWQLDRYKSNPVVLFGHDHDKPIGRAHNVRVEGGSLKADIEFAPEEVDAFAAKIGKMVKAGFLRAVSVGFKPLDMKPIKSGYEFIKSELLEISVVAVPANASALTFAKGFMQDEEISRVFAADPVIVRMNKAKAMWLLAKEKHGVIAT